MWCEARLIKVWGVWRIAMPWLTPISLLDPWRLELISFACPDNNYDCKGVCRKIITPDLTHTVSQCSTLVAFASTDRRSPGSIPTDLESMKQICPVVDAQQHLYRDVPCSNISIRNEIKLSSVYLLWYIILTCRSLYNPQELFRKQTWTLCVKRVTGMASFGRFCAFFGLCGGLNASRFFFGIQTVYCASDEG